VKKPVLVLTGPTGTGKTDWAARLAETLPVEIVSVDSALVYRGLDIGTAKPSRELRARVPHHLVDICEPTEVYSAGQFVDDAVALIAAIHSRGRLPLLVGGTMLYFRALWRGIAPLPRASPELRRSIDERAAREGWPALHAELARLDPRTAARVHPNDPQRIQRALEVCYATGRPISELQQSTRSAIAGVPHRAWSLVPANRDRLNEGLDLRFQRMMNDGFLTEVRTLHARGDLTADHPAVRAVGYRQLWAHLEGECTLTEAVRRGSTATRQLAKRQMTWIRSEPGLTWMDPFSDGAYPSWSADVDEWLASAEVCEGSTGPLAESP
jgi:tRNA dimethylallyltransferase